MKRNVIFGAGHYGYIALDKIGRDKVDFFLDNNLKCKGKLFEGKKIISPEEFVDIKDDYHVVVASIYSSSMIKQLNELGIDDYSVFIDAPMGFYDSYDLIVNPYTIFKEAKTEQDWSFSDKLEYSKKAVFDAVGEIYGQRKLFNHIEIETINRCNGSCSFCPVNHNSDPREKAVMKESLFYDIVRQLEDINYAGRFTTFSNNEPLLDDRIIDFNVYARKHLPRARMHLFTNGTLMTLEKFKDLVDVLDELIIDNYQQELKLIKPCVEIKEYCDKNPDIKKKVTIVLRKPNEILTSRGGNAPNRKCLRDFSNERCILPFKQLIVRPTGKVSLCCNDALGEYTLGDLNSEKILEVWYGAKFEKVREALFQGRSNWGKCKYCDTFNMG